MPRAKWVLLLLLLWGFEAACPGVLWAQAGAVMQELQQIARAAGNDRHGEAVRMLHDLLARNPEVPEAHYLLGRSLFCLGRVDEAAKAFDRYVDLRPEHRARQWERGIALYYAGRYEQAAEQFELYQSYHAGDVENAAWHFLCRAAIDGAAAAQARLLPVQGDTRIPMQEIYDLYRGAGSEDRIWRAVAAGNPDDAQRSSRSFYAHLYIGLYHQAWARPKEALRHIQQAVDDHRTTPSINRYMWWVAKVYVDRAEQE